MKFKLDEIEIGSQVFFESKDRMHNHDLFWTVTGISSNRLSIELKQFGFDEQWAIDISEVKYLMPKESDKSGIPS